MGKRFNVIFRGKTAAGENPEDVKRKLEKILKIDAAAVDRLFVGDSVTIRQDADASMAEKYQKAFQSAGAICHLEAVGPQDSTPAADASVPTASFRQDPESGAVVRTVFNAAGGTMVLTNIESVPGMTIVEHYGLVSGSTIRAKHVGRDLMASLKNLVGGELKGYTQLLNESRKQAMERMIEQAQQMGANAIVNIRFSTSSVAQGAAELYSYGTAVRVE